jgi:hypothetical protein
LHLHRRGILFIFLGLIRIYASFDIIFGVWADGVVRVLPIGAAKDVSRFSGRLALLWLAGQAHRRDEHALSVVMMLSATELQVLQNEDWPYTVRRLSFDISLASFG